MCTGLELAAMIGGPLLSAAGTMIQTNEAEANAKRQAAARNEKLNLTLAKNDKLADESRQAFNQRKENATDEATDKAKQDATEERQDTLQTAIPDQPTVSAPVSGSAPTVVKSEIAKRMADALGGAREQAQRLGTLGGYGDMWFDQGLQDTATGRDLSQNANFASGNMAILPYQQDIAETRAYKPISPIGGLLQGLGSGISSFGGSGGLPKKSYTTPFFG